MKQRLGEWKFYAERVGTYMGKISQLMVVYLFWKDAGLPLWTLPPAIILGIWIIAVVDMKYVYPGESKTQLKNNAEWAEFITALSKQFKRLEKKIDESIRRDHQEVAAPSDSILGAGDDSEVSAGVGDGENPHSSNREDLERDA